MGSGTIQRHNGSTLLSIAGEVANSTVLPTDPEWHPLDILHWVSNFIHKTQQTKHVLLQLLWRHEHCTNQNTYVLMLWCDTGHFTKRKHGCSARHGSNRCCTNDGLSSTRGLRDSSDLGGILRGKENLTPTTPVRVAKPNLHICFWGGTPKDSRPWCERPRSHLFSTY